MSEAEAEFELEISELLKETLYADHPLYAALSELFDRYRTKHRLLERLVRISDNYQLAERSRGKSFEERYEKKIHQLEKIAQISDKYQALLRDLNETLHKASITDDLTQLLNRRHMRECLEKEIARSDRDGESFSIALIDIDHFKRVNDEFGHATGDQVLRKVAACLIQNTRTYDQCARWGGEEFLILFPKCSMDCATGLAERIREFIAEDMTPSLTLSIGISQYQNGEEPDAILKRADDALYLAKAQGRNRTVNSDQTETEQFAR